MYIYHILFIHSLGFFHLLAVLNNAGMNMGVQISVRIPGFSSGYLRVSEVLLGFKYLMTIGKEKQIIKSKCPPLLTPVLIVSPETF